MLHQEFRTLRYGRLVAIDPRDRAYSLRAEHVRRTMKESEEGQVYPFVDFAELPKFRYWGAPSALDQNGTPQCVAYAHECLLMSNPVQNAPYKTPEEFYHECQLNDEWPGEDYDGTSGRGAMKVLQKAGLIDNYFWCENALDALVHLLKFGPVTIGTDWYYSMEQTEDYNYRGRTIQWLRVDANSGLAGGHETCLIGGSQIMKCPDGTIGSVQLQNSWGSDFGDNGRCFMSLGALDRLLKGWGDACASFEISAKDVTDEIAEQLT